MGNGCTGLAFVSGSPGPVESSCDVSCPRERAGMLKIAPQWVELFDEYEQGVSEEAQFVKSMDKLDMGLQAMHYQHQGLDLSQFITSARSKTDGTEFASLLE